VWPKELSDTFLKTPTWLRNTQQQRIWNLTTASTAAAEIRHLQIPKALSCTSAHAQEQS